MKRHKSAQAKSGMTLLEIVIAFTILILVITPFIKSFVSTSRSVKKSGEYTTALFLCQKIIEDIRSNLYNEDSTDFSEFLQRASDEDGLTVVPGNQCSRYFVTILDENDEADQQIIDQLNKYTVEINYGAYFVPLDPTEEEIVGGAELDVDGDGIDDPDAAMITVIVRWKDKTPASREEADREIKFSTVLSKAQHERREDISEGP